MILRPQTLKPIRTGGYEIGEAGWMIAELWAAFGFGVLLGALIF